MDGGPPYGRKQAKLDMPTRQIHFRLTEETLRNINEASAEAGLTRNLWLNEMLQEHFAGKHVEAHHDVIMMKIGDTRFCLDRHAAYSLHKELTEALEEVRVEQWVL